MKSLLVKNRLIIGLVVIALAAVYGIIGLDYAKQTNARDAAMSQISDITQNLNQVPAPPQDLPQKLAAAQARLAAAQSVPLDKPNSTQVINKILRLADECQVRAIPITTQPWSADRAGKGYQAFRLHIAVQGGFQELVSFLDRLENGDFGSLSVENLVVSRAANTSVVASLDVAIHARSTQ